MRFEAQHMPKSDNRPTIEMAEVVALNALNFLAQEPDRLGRFIALTGIGPDALRKSAAEPGILAAVLGHLLEDESSLLVFCTTFAIEPDDVGPAHARLVEAARESGALDHGADKPPPKP